MNIIKDFYIENKTLQRGMKELKKKKGQIYHIHDLEDSYG